MEITYNNRNYTHQDIKHMRDWVADCVFADLEQDEIYELPALEVLKGVDKHYDGGLAEFMITIQPA